MSAAVVVGAVNMDLHLFGLRRSAGQAPMVAEGYLAMPGGKGGNVARALARLGKEVHLVARVGDDEFGHDCVAAIAADGVDTSGVSVTPGEATGFVAIELIEGKHESIVLASGANDHLTWDEVAPALDGLDRDGLVVAQAEIPTQVLDDLCARCTDQGIPLFLDPTPPERVFRRHLEAADVITPNTREAAGLVGRVPGSRLWSELAARELLVSGARRVILKLSEHGALIGDKAGLTEVPTIDIVPTDETGAGDAFLAALAARRLDGADWIEATRFANVAAALSVEANGLHLPDRAEVELAERRLAS